MPDMKIAVDAMGGDDAPAVVLEGVAAALAERDGFEVVLTGPADVVEPFAASHERVAARACSETIGMGEHGAQAVRKKKDSSIVVGCDLVRDGVAQGFFSAGSTGACMAAATLRMGRVRGVRRPAIVSIIPSPAAKTVMCDIGANADCKPEYLVQFAQMGRVFAQAMLGVEDPRVGLLNIGAEEEKGSEFAQACHKLMAEQVPGFAGNAEGRAVALGGFDVIVTDGFTGNVVIKSFEGVGMALLSALKDTLTDSPKHKLGALLVKDGLARLKAEISADEYGAAQLLGVRGVCMIGHGSSSAKAVKNGILATVSAVSQDLPVRLARALEAPAGPGSSPAGPSAPAPSPDDDAMSGGRARFASFPSLAASASPASPAASEGGE